MKIQDWLKSYITTAFAGVTLDGGVDIHTAKFRDSYGFDDKDIVESPGVNGATGHVLIPNYFASVLGFYHFWMQKDFGSTYW